MSKVEKSFTIDGQVVEYCGELGNGFELYAREDRWQEYRYIVKNGTVWFEICVAAEGDECAHVSQFDVDCKLGK